VPASVGTGPQQPINAPAPPDELDPNYIEMPGDPAPPPVHLGFPTNPDEPAPQAIPSAAPMSPMQPGLGIPQDVFDAGAHEAIKQNLEAGADPLTGAPIPPEPTSENEIEFEPDQLTKEDRTASLQSMTPAEFAEYQAEFEETKRAKGAADLARAAKKDAADAEDDVRIFHDSRDKARAEAKQARAEASALANKKPEDGDWYEAGGVGRTVVAMLMAAAGGLVQHVNGGKNIGLDMVHRSIERFVAQETAKLSAQRAEAGERVQAADRQVDQSYSDLKQAAVLRSAAWERTVRLIEAEQQNYVPGGTTALRMEEKRRDAIALMTKADRDAELLNAKRLEAEAKAKREEEELKIKQAAQAESVRNNMAQNKASQTSAAASYLSAKTGAKKTDAEIKAMEAENTPREPEYFEEKFGKDARPPGRMSPKEYDKWIANKAKLSDAGKNASETSKAASEATIAAAKARLEGSGPGGSPYAVSDQEGKPIRRKDGSILEIQDTAQRNKANDIMTAAKNVRRIADLVKIMRADKGGASSAVGSDEYQELQSLASQIDFETFVGYGLGAPSDGDKALAQGVRGGKDISSFIHDPAAGFEAYAKGIEEKANTELLKHGEVPYVKFKSIEPAQALERSTVQNMDVWNAPTISDASVPEDIRKRDAERAIGTADALAKQSDPWLIRQFAKENQERVQSGLISPEMAAKAQKSFRREFKRRIANLNKERDVEQLQKLGVWDDTTGRVKFGDIDGDEAIDAAMGIQKGAE
jgi:hypothetical protein